MRKTLKALFLVVCAVMMSAIFLTACTPAATYTVKFNSQGGSAVTDQTEIASGGKVTKPTDPTRADYEFGGWYKEAGCTNAWNFNTDTVTADITLYAKWTEVVPVDALRFELDVDTVVALCNANTLQEVNRGNSPDGTPSTFSKEGDAIKITAVGDQDRIAIPFDSALNVAATAELGKVTKITFFIKGNNGIGFKCVYSAAAQTGWDNLVWLENGPWLSGSLIEDENSEFNGYYPLTANLETITLQGTPPTVGWTADTVGGFILNGTPPDDYYILHPVMLLERAEA